VRARWLDYRSFAGDPLRARSPEVDFGVGWRLLEERDGFPWRVAWLEATGELYAVELRGYEPGRALLLGHFLTREAAEEALEGWAERPLRLGPLGNPALLRRV